MLIAIMGDTFDKVNETKERSGMREKIEILADYVWFIPMDRNEVTYIFEMKPKGLHEDGKSTWEGTVSTLKKCIETSMKAQK